jgi:hypothetical protein
LERRHFDVQLTFKRAQFLSSPSSRTSMR